MRRVAVGYERLLAAGHLELGSPVTKDQPDAAMEAADLPSKPVPISTDQAAVGLSQGNAVISVAQAAPAR
jgi:hypothetical protein